MSSGAKNELPLPPASVLRSRPDSTGRSGRFQSWGWVRDRSRIGENLPLLEIQRDHEGHEKDRHPPGGNHWNRSPEEVKDIYSRLPPLDDAGEPTIVNSTGTSHLNEPTTVTITKTRKIDWHSWFNKPKFLVEGLTTINGNPKIIMFSLPPTSEYNPPSPRLHNPTQQPPGPPLYGAPKQPPKWGGAPRGQATFVGPFWGGSGSQAPTHITGTFHNLLIPFVHRGEVIVF